MDAPFQKPPRFAGESSFVSQLYQRVEQAQEVQMEVVA